MSEQRIGIFVCCLFCVIPTTNAIADDEAKMKHLKEVAAAVVEGATLEDLYKRHPEAKEGSLVTNPDGSQQLRWGDSLVYNYALLGNGKVLSFKWRMLRLDKAAAEKEALQPKEVFGTPRSTAIPKGELRLESCNHWRHKEYTLRTGVWKGKFDGADAYYVESNVTNMDALEKLIKK